LLLSGRSKLQEQSAFTGIWLSGGNLEVQPRGFLFVIPVVDLPHEDVLVLFSVFGLVFVLIIVQVVVVFVLVIPVVVFIVFVIILVLGFGPALGFLGELQIHFVPGLEVDFLDVPIEIFDLDELGILVHGQHPEWFFFFQVLVPLSWYRLVISAHALTLKDPSSSRS
jgi:hypothetical protein